MNKIGFIGGGKIAQAMANGFIKAGMLLQSRQSIAQHRDVIAYLAYDFPTDN